MSIEDPQLTRWRRSRAQAKRRARSLMNKAKEENRSLTSSEEQEVDEMIAAAEEADERIERILSGDDDDQPDARLAFHDGGTMNSNAHTRVEFEDPHGNRHVGVRGGNFYEIMAEENGWPDRDDVTGVGERIANQISGQRAVSSTGGLAGAIPDPARAEILDRLVNQTFLREAGAVFISPDSETLTVSRTDSKAGLEWLSPGSTASSTDPTFASQTLDFATFRGVIDVNRETVQDAGDLPDAIERELTRTMREELERVSLVGGAASTNEPVGITESSAVNTVNIAGSTSGSAITSTGAGFDDILERKEALLNDNTPEANLSYVLSPREARQFATLKTTGNVYLDPPPQVEQLDRFVTSAMPTTFAPGSLTNASKIVVGDWSDALVGLRMDPTVEAFRGPQADNFQLRLLAAMRMDIVPQRPGSFEVIERITT